MLPVEHSIEGEQHVVGVHLTAGGELLVAVKLDPFAQVEGVGQAVIGHLPAFCQGRFDRSGAAFEFDQTVVDRLGGVVVGGAGVLGGVETTGAALGAEHQVLGQADGGLGEQAEAQQCCKNWRMAHDYP
ncbi:hypothetical protein D9M71_477560 [compost metagenome]